MESFSKIPRPIESAYTSSMSLSSRSPSAIDISYDFYDFRFEMKVELVGSYLIIVEKSFSNARLSEQ